MIEPTPNRDQDLTDAGIAVSLVRRFEPVARRSGSRQGSRFSQADSAGTVHVRHRLQGRGR